MQHISLFCKKCFYLFCSCIAYDQSNDFGGRTVKKTELPKVIVFRNDRQPMQGCEPPNIEVRSPVQADVINVRTAGI